MRRIRPDIEMNEKSEEGRRPNLYIYLGKIFLMNENPDRQR